jgi:hypothetical protein
VNRQVAKEQIADRVPRGLIELMTTWRLDGSPSR